jgi:hypothetical protein
MRKNLPIFTGVIGLLVGGGAGFLLARSVYLTPTAPTDRPGVPTREQLLNYLDGQAFNLPTPNDKGDPREHSHTLRREQIEAFEVDTRATRINSEPWTVEVKMVLNTGQGRYVIGVEVQNELIENERVFYGYQVKSVTKQ